MPVKVKRLDGKFRVVEADGSIATNRAGTALDGGGHTTKTKAIMQVGAVNSSIANRTKRKKKKKQRGRSPDRGQDIAR